MCPRGKDSNVHMSDTIVIKVLMPKSPLDMTAAR
jgi:hypothetical protein